jgi:hypothetical protein
MNMNHQSEDISRQTLIPHPGLFARIFRFYLGGFRRMTLGRTLWKLIIIKLIIMFAVLKLFFFQGFLESKFTTDNQRSAYVIDQITQFAPNTNTQQEGKKND